MLKLLAILRMWQALGNISESFGVHTAYFCFPISLFLHAEKRDTLYWTPKVNGTKWCSWGIQIGPFRVHKTYLSYMNFHFINRPHAAFSFSCMQRNGYPTLDPKVNETKGCITLGHQVGPFWLHKTYFCKTNFHFINKPHAAFPFSCMQRTGNWTGYPHPCSTTIRLYCPTAVNHHGRWGE